MSERTSIDAAIRQGAARPDRYARDGNGLEERAGFLGADCEHDDAGEDARGTAEIVVVECWDEQAYPSCEEAQRYRCDVQNALLKRHLESVTTGAPLDLSRLEGHTRTQKRGDGSALCPLRADPVNVIARSTLNVIIDSTVSDQPLRYPAH